MDESHTRTFVSAWVDEIKAMEATKIETRLFMMKTLKQLMTNLRKTKLFIMSNSRASQEFGSCYRVSQLHVKICFCQLLRLWLN